MTVRLNPYIPFRDNAREAMEFYHSVFGGNLTVNTFGDFGTPVEPGQEDKIMHAMLEGDNGLVLMGADTPSGMEYQPPGGISISLSGDDEPTLRRYWEALSSSGNAVTPFEKAPWGDIFGMCTDGFGINWMVNATAAQS